METTLPEWLTQAFASAKWWDMSNTCDWADGMFSSGEYNVEVFGCVAHTGAPFWRLLATVDGDTYISTGKGFVTDEPGVRTYLEYITPRLENLADAL